MTDRSSATLINRFRGKAGQRHLISELCAQALVGGDREIATKLAKAGKLMEAGPDEVLVTQGTADDDLFLLITGEVSITINGRKVATRAGGSHVGEMTVVDRTARRSGTVVTTESTLYLKVAERQISQIAETHPDMWRRLAVQMAVRLRERSKFLEPPNATPVVFVGSSTEGLAEATWLTESINRATAVAQLWTEGVFELSDTTIESLLKQAQASDFAVLVLTPDDMTRSRGSTKRSPRDNAIFELGLFMGALTRDRVFIVTPRGVDLKLPTDILGITRVIYSRNRRLKLAERLRPVAKDIKRRIKDLGPK